MAASIKSFTLFTFPTWNIQICLYELDYIPTQQIVTGFSSLTYTIFSSFRFMSNIFTRCFNLFLNLKLATVYHVSLPPPNNNKIRFPGSFCTRTWIFLCWWFFLPCFFLLFCLSFLPFLLSFHFLSFFFSCVLCLVLWFVNKTLSLYFLSISLTLLLLDSWLEFSLLSLYILHVNDL